MKTLITSFISLFLFIPIHAQSGENKEYKVNEVKQIVVQELVEGLSLSKADIYNVAATFMADAYDSTKFKISVSDEVNGTIIGEGSLVNFFSYQLGLNQYYLNLNFKLRVDAKEARTRISVIADTYSGKCIEYNTTTDIDDKIADFQPVCKTNDNKRRMYTKAFPKMLETFRKIIEELTEKLRLAQGTADGNDDW